MRYYKSAAVAIAFVLLICAYFLWQRPVHLQIACTAKPGVQLVVRIPAEAELLGPLPDGMARNRNELKWTPSDSQSGHYTLELLWAKSWRPYRMTCQVDVSQSEPLIAYKPSAPLVPQTQPPPIQLLPVRPFEIVAPAPPKLPVHPQFLTTPVTRIRAGEPWSYQPEIAVSNGKEARLTLHKAPPGMVLDATKTLRWTPGEGAVGQYEVSLLAGDTATLIAFQNFTLSTAALFKVGSFGDWPQTIQPLNNGTLLGLSQARLMLFPGHLNEIMASYWTPSRGPRTFLCNKGYVFLGEDNVGIDIFDVRDGKNIIPRGRIPVINRGSHYNALSNDILIVAGERDFCLYFFSVADPEKPEQLSKLFMGINKNPYSVRTHGTIAYVHGHKFIAAVDFKDPRQPRILSEVAISTEGCFGAFVSYPPYVYQFGRERVIVDTSKPDQLKLFRTSKETEIATLAEVKGQRLMLYGTGGAFEMDFADPAMPRTVSFFNSRKYQLGAGPGGLYQTLPDGKVVLLKDGARPDERGDPNGNRYEGVATSGTLAYVVGTSLDILDLSHPRQPRRMSNTPIRDGSHDVTPLFYEHVLFTGDGFWDVRNPEQPTITRFEKPAQAFASGAGCVCQRRCENAVNQPV